MEIEKALKRLLIKEPFYGLFCLSLPKNVTRKVETLCVGKNGINCELFINPDFWAEHTDDEQIALLKHELSHICLQHMFMSESFSDPRTFNLAADLEVNSYIQNLPQSACIASKFGLEPEQGTKYYYEELTKDQKAQAKNPQKPCNGGQGNQNQQQSPSPSKSSTQNSEASQDGNSQEGESKQQYPDSAKGCKPIDSHDKWKDFREAPEAVKQLMQSTINTTLKQTAEQVEKQRGTIPGELREVIEKLRKKKPEIFNWKKYFRRLLGSIYDVNIKSTRRKESKRFEGAAGIQHRKKVSMLVAVDTSGSVSTKELNDFFAEIDYIYKAGAKITLIECDSRINKITEYDGKNIPEILGRGGTDFNPPVKYYLKHRKEYASLVYFTDGYAPLPDDNPSGIVWIITSNGAKQEYPGKTVYIPVEQKE